ncbi:Crp/Fnr family transcriptional regulator [Sphingomonas floccifaciens]|uniref:Crp/Fnr family transcriptional regulator n=1 Tax=Sphingomonas floccifaciens TaxID=1844115 RepID=A0ABW4N7W3_9SPHN
MPDYPLNRFKDVFALSPEEAQMLQSLGDPPVRYRRYTTIRREGDPIRGIYLLIEGWACSSILLPSGLRQIVKLHLPGDMLGTPGMVLAKAGDTLLALTDVSVAFVPMARLRPVFEESPRLTAFLFAAVQMERIALMDIVALMGRSSARERYATFLVNVHDRLLSTGVGEADRFELPLTQEQIGDVLGLTMVHTNRTVRALEREGLIAREGSTLILRDPAAIRRLSPLPKRVAALDLEWAPRA